SDGASLERVVALDQAAQRATRAPFPDVRATSARIDRHRFAERLERPERVLPSEARLAETFERDRAAGIELERALERARRIGVPLPHREFFAEREGALARAWHDRDRLFVHRQRFVEPAERAIHDAKRRSRRSVVSIEAQRLLEHVGGLARFALS